MKSIVEQHIVKSINETTSVVSKNEVTEVLTSREVVNLTINYIGSRAISKNDITNNEVIGVVGNTELIQRVFVSVTEAFDDAEMTIGDDGANGRLITVNDVNLSKIGMYEIATYLQYDQQRETKIYFNKVNTVGKLNVIIIIG